MTGYNIGELGEDGSRVAEFYAGQTVFITGGTGFLGKLLLEKLLRTCGDVKAVYLLVRQKKGETPGERLERLFHDVLFERLEKQVPNYKEKVHLVSGDFELPCMGLSTSDADILTQEVTVVFNVAATVRFIEKLKQALIINVKGTAELLKLCASMQNLRAIVHVSTAYSNCNYSNIHERFYEPPISAEKALDLIEKSEEELNEIESEALETFPNTYTFSKCIAEDLVRQYGKKLPIAVCRPAMVLSTYNEPLEGWIDSPQGPTSFLVSAGAGLLRTVLVSRDLNANMVPADYTVNLILTTARTTAIAGVKNDEPTIYNYTGSGITWGRYYEMNLEFGKEIPSIHSVWCYTLVPVTNYYLYLLLLLLLHWIPAVIYDFGLLLCGKKPRIIGLYKKIHEYSTITAYFTLNEWKFSDDNVASLWKSLDEMDKKLFPFYMEDFDWADYMRKYVRGIRSYIFKDDPSTIPAARRRIARFKILQECIKYAFILAMIYATYWIVRHALTIAWTIGNPR